MADLAEPQTPEAQARDLALESFGPRTAAWLVGIPMARGTYAQRARQREMRRSLRRNGMVDLRLPETLPEHVRERLRWFFLAVEQLRRRSGWAVEVQTHRGWRTYRVRWLSWRGRAPERAS